MRPTDYIKISGIRPCDMPGQAAAKVPTPTEDEDEENWENDLVEHSYNPLEVVRRS